MKYEIFETECGIYGGLQAEYKLIRLYSCEHQVWDVYSDMQPTGFLFFSDLYSQSGLLWSLHFEKDVK